MMRLIRELVITTAMVFTVLWLITTVSRAEQLDPEQITSQMAEHYVKQLFNIQHLNLGIDVPEQVDISIKRSQYQFQHGGNITIKHSDPTRITYSYQRGNHNLSIRGDHIGYHFTKQFNWAD